MRCHNMVKKVLKILAVLFLLTLVVTGMFFYSIYVSVDRVNISYQNITSPKIPEDMNDIKIAFITDVKYNEFMDKKRLTKMIHKLTTTGADIVIFGGDMFSYPEKKAPDSQMKRDLITIFKSIQAPLGKFAVLGDEDLINNETKELVSAILYDSDFEIITNTSVRLRNKSTASITLVGLDSSIGGKPDALAAMKKVSDKEFNMLVTHSPDAIKTANINVQNLNLIMAGHSLGGQIYIPILGPLHGVEGAKTYNHGSYTLSATTKLFVSNGLGTKNIDMRFLSPPQILLFRLQHTKEAS